MKKPYERSFVGKLEEALKRKNALIHVVIGPRQVGKTTGIKQLLSRRREDQYTYLSADAPIAKSADWIYSAWTEAVTSKSQLLVIDEIQNVEDWSSVIKELWDKQSSRDEKLQIILLGSSSLNISQGIEESLVGRFFLHEVSHWDDRESKAAFGLELEQYLLFGGYPGSYDFLDDDTLWLQYINNSIINPVISKDILSQARVKSAALFKQCFDMVCSYPAQEMSYNKLLGQLQDKGNINLVKHYLNLYESAFLIKQLYKFSPKKILQQSSSPKLLPLCPALFSRTQDANYRESDLGRVFELLIGVRLLQLPGRLSYWREGKYEVDYVYEYKSKVYAIEVKYRTVKRLSGLRKFQQKFPDTHVAIVTPENYNDFLNDIC